MTVAAVRAALLGVAISLVVTGTGGAAPSANEPAGVSIAVEAGAQASARIGYTVRLVNGLDRTVSAVVTQELPPGAGRVTTDPAGAVENGTAVWRPVLLPGATLALRVSAVLPDGADGRRVSSACVGDTDSGRLLDCAAAVLGSGRASAGERPWWHTTPLWAMALAAAVVVAVVSGLVWLARRYHHDRYGGLPALAALALLAGLAAGAIAWATPRMTSTLEASRDYGDVGWSGPRRTLLLGGSASDDVVEFTAYRLHCSQALCAATVGLRNLTAEPQLWFREMQRVRLSDGSWLAPDRLATARANGGSDLFAEPLPVGARLVGVLVFEVPGGARPVRLELREGALARGVVLHLE